MSMSVLEMSVTAAAGLLGATIEQFSKASQSPRFAGSPTDGRVRADKRTVLVRAAIAIASGGFAAGEVIGLYTGSFLGAAVAALQVAPAIAAFREFMAGTFSDSQTPGSTAAARVPAQVVGLGGGLTLEGFWSVYGVACFGALLIELYALYKKRTKLPKYPWYYWPISAAMIAASGGVTVLYGTHNVNALLAVQLGASAPILIKRFQR